MSRFCPLFSSSKGNCSFISGGGTTLLVDIGISLRQLTHALECHELSPDQLSGVLITHEHSDHIRGLAMLLKKFDVPLYASRGTLDFLCTNGHVPGRAKVEELMVSTDIDGIEVTPFDTPHDACESTGFRFVLPDGTTAAVATDLGHVTDTVRRYITGCDLVLLESNYDRGMLDCSSYPYSLKRRIRGEFGHLGNEDCAAECARLIATGTSRLVLGHLSEQNNLPALARQVTKLTLDGEGMRENIDYILSVAPARGESHVITF